VRSFGEDGEGETDEDGEGEAKEDGARAVEEAEDTEEVRSTTGSVVGA
jgi:hypothetical protein